MKSLAAFGAIAEKLQMSDPIDTKSTKKATTVICSLIAFHAIAGIVLGFFSADQPAVSTGLFLGLIFCQTSLLGMWSGLGKTHWLLRLAGLAGGTVYLASLLGLGIDELEGEVFLLVALATLLVASATWVVRIVKAVVTPIDESAADAREGLQFTILHLMLLTFAVACLVTIGKLLAPFLPGLDEVSMMSVIALCFLGVALMAIWAMLGFGHPLLRCVLTFACAIAMGWFIAYAIDDGDYVFWISVTILQAIYMLASLYAIRMCGYRLLARR